MFAHTHAHVRIGGAAGLNCRASSKTDRARPPRCALPAESGAYIEQRGDRCGIPCADVGVERRRRVERLRAEPPAIHADGRRSHVWARMHRRPIAHEHTSEHGRSTWARVCGAPASVIGSSGKLDAHGYRYMHASCIYVLYLCVFHRLMALRRERVALPHVPRISATSARARDRTRTQGHTRVPIYTTELCSDI